MGHLSSKADECFILVKAQPHRSSKYSETVCCAGVGRDGLWRRQYPVAFRILNEDQKFKRWQWISYRYSTSRKDTRRESQKVVPESLAPGGLLKQAERAKFLNPLIRASFAEAERNGESLVLLRPKKFEFLWEEKSDQELAEERVKHAELANQSSLFDSTAKPLEPCPFQFIVKWIDQDGTRRQHECDDWESAAAFRRFERLYGRQDALQKLKAKYEDEYFPRGLAFAFSTHSRRNVTFGASNQWLLVGLIRLDESPQTDLLLGSPHSPAST